MSNLFNSDAEVRLEGYPVVWATGRELLNVMVQLGHNERSTNCTVTIADVTGKIAADLIKHVAETGGIQKLPDSKPTTATTSTPSTTAGSATQYTYSPFSPERKAILDLIGWAEGANYNTMYGGGTFTSYKDHPDKVISASGIASSAAGRYQFLTPTWDGARKALNLPDFSPTSQDKAAIYLIQGRSALADVDSGNIDAFLDKCSYEWASLPPYRYPGQGTKTTADCKKYYAERLAYYRSSSPISKTIVDTTTNSTNSNSTNSNSQTDTFKGAKLLVRIGETEFEFFHQETEANNDGTTTLTGQGVRYVLNRRRRNKTIQNASLKDLATQVAKAHRIKLAWLADFDPLYTHLAQNGITDYQLLKRECEQNGLFLGEANGTLTIKSLRQVRDTAILLAPGLNLIKWNVKDTAIDSKAADISSALGQNEPKAEIDPLSGTLTQKKADIDTASTNDVTGKASADTIGTLEPASKAIADANRARYKRVKGLPSTFVLPLQQWTLQIAPMDAVRTEGLSGVLSRIWFVDTVKHDLLAGTSTLTVFSPVEVLDLTPEAANGTNPATLQVGNYIFPVKGFPVTDLVGYSAWRGRMHAGTDVGTPIGTPVVAMANGRVAFAAVSGGYGNLVRIQHSDGRETYYAHLDSMSVRVGQDVKQAQQIGTSGNTGIGTGAHLHFEVRDPGGNPVTPDAVGLPKVTKGMIL